MGATTLPLPSTAARFSYAFRRLAQDPVGFKDEFLARRSLGRLADKSVSELPYVQICGSVKSGTSLLHSLFDDVPGFVTYPHESALTGEYYPKLRNSNPLKDAEFYHWLVEYYLAAVGRPLTEVGQSRPAVFDPAFIWRVRANMRRTLRTCGNFWDAHAGFMDSYLLEAGIEPEGLWLDKSPFAHLFYDEIKAARPEAKFIHILRHPAGTLASTYPKYVKATDPDLEGLLWSFSRFAHYSFVAAEKHRADPDYYIIRYEDLCTNPEEELSRLCSFLGIEPDLRMFAPTNAGQAFVGNNWEGMEFDNISAHSVNRWRRKLPPYFVNACCFPTAELMEAFSYTLPAPIAIMEADYAEHLANVEKIPVAELRGKYDPEVCPTDFT